MRSCIIWPLLTALRLGDCAAMRERIEALRQRQQERHQEQPLTHISNILLNGVSPNDYTSRVEDRLAVLGQALRSSSARNIGVQVRAPFLFLPLGSQEPFLPFIFCLSDSVFYKSIRKRPPYYPALRDSCLLAGHRGTRILFSPLGLMHSHDASLLLLNAL